MIELLLIAAGIGGLVWYEKGKSAAVTPAANTGTPHPLSNTIQPIPPVGLTYDPGMSSASQDAVNQALLNENNPDNLLSLATTLDAKGYKVSAAALRAKATAIKAAGGAPIVPPIIPTPPPSPPMDAGITPDIQSYIDQALSTQTDVPSLQSMAGQLQGQGYNNAAALILAKIASLQGGPVTPNVSPNVLASLTLPAGMSINPDGTLNFGGSVQQPTSPDDTSPMTAIAVQHALNQLGYGPLAEDGSIGPATSAAISSFQSNSGLAADGLPGPQTWAALRFAMTSAGITSGAYNVVGYQLYADYPYGYRSR